MGIRIFIAEYEKEYEKSFSYKTGGFSESLATRTSHKFQLPNNKMAKVYFLFCSDPAVLTLQLPTCFTRVHNSSESPLASQSRVPVTRMLLGAHT